MTEQHEGLVQETASPQVVTIGEEMVLFWPEHGDTLEDAVQYRRSFGGAEGNFAIALSRLGVSTRWVSRLGDDAFGRSIRNALMREGVQVSAQVDTLAPTAVFFKEGVQSGPRRVLYYRKGSAASRMSPSDLAPELFAGARLLHLTGITPALSESCALMLREAITLARAAGCLVSIDPNVRLQIWPSAAACREYLLGLFSEADVVLLGDEDASVLFPDLAEELILPTVRALGPTTVVLKMGSRGARANSHDEEASVAAFPVQVIDTVGAGDGFDAGFVAGSLWGWPLLRCLQLGARVGAAAVSVAGDWEGYPHRDSLEFSTEGYVHG